MYFELLRHSLSFLYLTLVLVSGCRPNPVSDPEIAGRVWQICDGHELTRAILDACGQRPVKGDVQSSTHAPCNNSRRYRRMIPEWMLHLDEKDRLRVEGKEKLPDDVGHDVVRNGMGRQPMVGAKRTKRSPKIYWIRVLNKLYEKCCTKGCLDEDLIQLC